MSFSIVQDDVDVVVLAVAAVVVVVAAFDPQFGTFAAQSHV